MVSVDLVSVAEFVLHAEMNNVTAAIVEIIRVFIYVLIFYGLHRIYEPVQIRFEPLGYSKNSERRFFL